jgi:hypothetical protein
VHLPQNRELMARLQAGESEPKQDARKARCTHSHA